MALRVEEPRVHERHELHVHGERLERLRLASERKQKPIAALQDLCGPKIRVTKLPNGQVELVPGVLALGWRDDLPDVIASCDCGFGTFAGYGKLDPDISFKKLQAMADGAAIASQRLWGRH